MFFKSHTTTASDLLVSITSPLSLYFISKSPVFLLISVFI